MRFLIATLVATLTIVSSAQADFGFVSFPATGSWNGFNSQLNVAECTNFSSSAVTLNIEVIRANGQAIGSQQFSIASKGTVHTILNAFTDDSDLGITNDYGIYRLQRVSGPSTPKVSCMTSIYRLSLEDSNLPEYAFALPVRPAFEGPVYGIYDSQNPGASTVPVQNWLTINNPNSDGTFRGSLVIYSADGEQLSSQSIDLAPGERTDIGLGHSAGETSGIYKVVPSNDTSFGAFLTRYDAVDSSSYNFAYALSSVSGSCGEKLSASTMGRALNSLELGNPNNNNQDISIVVRDRFGETVHSEARTLAANSHQSLPLNSFIDEAGTGNVGSVTVSCDEDNTQLIVESIYYGTAPADATQITWGYGTQALNSPAATSGDAVVGAANTFFNAANWLKLASSSSSANSLVAQVFDPNGSIEASENETLPASGTLDFGVHQHLSSDSIGTVSASSSSSETSYTGELVRVYLDSSGEIAEIMPTPLSIVSNGGVSSNVQSYSAAAIASMFFNAQSGEDVCDHLPEISRVLHVMESGFPFTFGSASDQITTTQEDFCADGEFNENSGSGPDGNGRFARFTTIAETNHACSGRDGSSVNDINRGYGIFRWVEGSLEIYGKFFANNNELDCSITLSSTGSISSASCTNTDEEEIELDTTSSCITLDTYLAAEPSFLKGQWGLQEEGAYHWSCVNADSVQDEDGVLVLDYDCSDIQDIGMNYVTINMSSLINAQTQEITVGGNRPHEFLNQVNILQMNGIRAAFVLDFVVTLDGDPSNVADGAEVFQGLYESESFMTTLNAMVLEFAEYLELRDTFIYIPLMEFDKMLGGYPNASEWGQEILPQLRNVFSGSIAWIASSPNIDGSTNVSGYDLFGFNFSPLRGETLEDIQTSLRNGIARMKSVCSAGGVEQCFISAYGFWDEVNEDLYWFGADNRFRDAFQIAFNLTLTEDLAGLGIFEGTQSRNELTIGADQTLEDMIENFFNAN